MNQLRLPASFDYILSLDGIGPTEFVGWTTECQLRDFNRKLIAIIPSAWVDPTIPVALELVQLDTSKWKPGVAILDVIFTGPEGYVRTLENPIQWELVR